MSRSRPSLPQRPTAPTAPASSRLAWLDVTGPYLLPLLALLVTRVWFAVKLPYAAEDAYITFRYAWNFANGHGPVYNPGEHVWGFTSAPWMAFLALGIKLGLQPILWSRIGLLLADIVTLLTIGALLERHASRAAARSFNAFFALWPYFAALAATGLEMSAFLALIGLSAWLLDRRHPAAGVALGLLAVFRPEGLPAAVVLAAWAARRDRLIGAGLAALVLLALTLYFGSPIPQSVRAKAIVYGMPGPLQSMQWWDWTLPLPLWSGLARTSEGGNLLFVSILLTPAALAGIVALWAKRTTGLAGAVAAGVVVWIGYVAAGASYFFWYLSTPLLAWSVCAGVGLPRIVRGRLVYACALLAVLGRWFYEPNLYLGRTLGEEAMFGSAGDYLAGLARPGESVLLEPIGHVGWRNRELRVLDEVGLVTPAVAERRAKGAGWYPDVLGTTKPDWLVVRSPLLMRGEAFIGTGAPFRDGAERARVLNDYRVVAMGDSVPSEANLVILRRVEGR